MGGEKPKRKPGRPPKRSGQKESKTTRIDRNATNASSRLYHLHQRTTDKRWADARRQAYRRSLLRRAEQKRLGRYSVTLPPPKPSAAKLRQWAQDDRLDDLHEARALRKPKEAYRKRLARILKKHEKTSSS